MEYVNYYGFLMHARDTPGNSLLYQGKRNQRNLIFIKEGFYE